MGSRYPVSGVSRSVPGGGKTALNVKSIVPKGYRVLTSSFEVRDPMAGHESPSDLCLLYSIRYVINCSFGKSRIAACNAIVLAGNVPLGRLLEKA